MSPSGEIRLSPDNRIRSAEKLGWKGWQCFEANTAREKESVGARMAEQLWQKKRNMKIQQVLREQEKRNELKASARIRLAKSHTQFDTLCNKKILERLEQDEDRLYRELSEEFSNANRTSGLEIEFKEAAMGFYATRGEKQAGING